MRLFPNLLDQRGRFYKEWWFKNDSKLEERIIATGFNMFISNDKQTGTTIVSKRLPQGETHTRSRINISLTGVPVICHEAIWSLKKSRRETRPL